MAAITLSLDKEHDDYLRAQAEEEKRDMSRIVELALDLYKKRKTTK